MKFLTQIACLAALISCQTAFGQVTHLTEKQWVKSVDGNLQGRIILPTEGGAASAVKEATVALVDRDGKILKASAKTNAKGEFQIAGVKPGVYALTARADYVFACCAMHVLGNEADKAFPTSVEIAAANIDFTTVKTAVIRYMPPKVRDFDFSIEKANLTALTPQVTGKDFFRVIQSGDGMRGRLHCAGAFGDELDEAQLTNVFIMKNGLEAARTVTNENGEFTIDKLDPGQYSLMAIGPEGLGMVGFELVSAEDSIAQTTTDGKQFVGVSANCCCQEFAMQVAPPCEQIISDVVISEQVIDPCGGCGQPVDACGCGQVVDPCGCGAGVPIEGEIIDDGFGTPLAGGYGAGGGGGYYGGGGGGGGGLLGGGGGFGAIAGLAGLGGVIAAVADDDDGNAAGGGGGGGVIIPPPASPAVPN